MTEPINVEASAATIGAINPKALAELRLGRTLDPAAPDFEQTVSAALETDYAKLFDPKFGSPIYTGLSHFFAPPQHDVPIEKVDLGHRLHLNETLRVGLNAGGPALAPRPILDTHLDLTKIIQRPVWWPLLTDLTYKYLGDFIVDVPTITSPVQGALGDCWLISAMASVAWVHPDAIAERTLRAGDGVLADGGADYEFTFYAASNWSAPVQHSARDDVPVNAAGNYIYARSNVAGETWPANLEKTFIAMRGATGFLEPSSANYAELSGGDPAWAVASLVGRPPFYVAGNDPNAWNVLTSHCSSGKTTTPLTAWTFGTEPTGANYGGQNIVANHAYSILGVETVGATNYVVLRNPWGYFEGTGPNTVAGQFQGLTLPGDGVFALCLQTFGQCFAGFGGA